MMIEVTAQCRRHSNVRKGGWVSGVEREKEREEGAITQSHDDF